MLYEVITAWDTDRLPRRATVSSLGMGGTNAHAILEEAPEPRPTSPSRGQQLFLFSARSQASLDVAIERMTDHFETHPELDIADVTFTLQVGVITSYSIHYTKLYDIDSSGPYRIAPCSDLNLSTAARDAFWEPESPSYTHRHQDKLNALGPI